MTVVTDLDLPHFDYTDPSLHGGRFHALMRDLRQESWLVSGPFGYVVLDRESVEFFLRSRSTNFPGMEMAEIFGVTEGPLREEISRNILSLHGDDHRRLRNLVNPAFTPRAADRFRPAMRGFLEQLYGGIADDGRCEFVGAFAKPYPSLMIATVMGAPLEDAMRLHEWSNLIQRQFDAPSLMNDRERIEQAVVEFYDYVGELIRDRRERPGDDLLSSLVALEQEGDRLSDVECVNLALNVLIGGVDTTQSQLAQGIRLFAEHPEQWELLRAQPDLVAQAVEEVLRFEPITPFTARITLEDVEYRGVTFPRGTVLMVSAFNANRAAADGADTERFDIAADRRSAKPLTFGAGIHFCLGANLARAELQEGFSFLSRRMRDLQLDGEPVFDTVTGIYGLRELPIRFDPSEPV